MITDPGEDDIPAGLRDLQGAGEVLNWFGFWPTFHDSELDRIEVDERNDLCQCSVRSWRTAEEPSGAYTREKQAIVTFVVHGVMGLSLSGPLYGSVFYDIVVQRTNGMWAVSLNDTYGVHGKIEGKDLSFRVRPA